MTSFGTVGLIKLCQANPTLVAPETTRTAAPGDRGQRSIQDTMGGQLRKGRARVEVKEALICLKVFPLPPRG